MNRSHAPVLDRLEAHQLRRLQQLVHHHDPQIKAVSVQRNQQPANFTAELRETGVKVVDLFGPLRDGDLVLVDGDYGGFGMVVLLGELTIALQEGGYGPALWTGLEQSLLNHREVHHHLSESGQRDTLQLAFVPAELEGEEAPDELQRTLEPWGHGHSRLREKRMLVVFQAAGKVTLVEAVQPYLTSRGARAATAFMVTPEIFPSKGAKHA
jgi:hypothetical protein